MLQIVLADAHPDTVQNTTFQIISYMKEAEFMPFKLFSVSILDMMQTLHIYNKDERKPREKAKGRKGKGKKEGILCKQCRWYVIAGSLSSQRAA